MELLPADVVDATGYVSPLITAAYLDATVVQPKQLVEVVGLQDLVRELGEAHAFLLTVSM